MKKRITSIALVLCMVLTLLPMSALAASPDGWPSDTSTLQVNDTITIDDIDYTYKGDASTSGIQMYTGDVIYAVTALTEACCWKAGSGYVLYQPTVENSPSHSPYDGVFTGDVATSAVVTLHDAAISTSAAFALSLPYNSSGPYSLPVPVTVKVEGTNSLSTTDARYDALYHEAGDTTFTGGGSLSITGKLSLRKAATIDAGTQVTVSGGSIGGDLTVTGSGSKLTIASGAELVIGVWGGPPIATVTVKDGGVLENNGTLRMVERVDKDNPHIVGEISGNGEIQLDQTLYTLVGGVFYPYGGDASTSGLDLSSSVPTEVTCYKAGNGYISYTPAVTGDNAANAKLELNNATINTTSGRALYLPAEPVDITVIGNNSLTANGSYAIDTNEQAVNITGGGSLSLIGSNGIVPSSGYTPSITINIGGALNIKTTSNPIQNVSRDIKITAKSITIGDAYGIFCDNQASIEATDGDITLTGGSVMAAVNGNHGVSLKASGKITVDNSAGSSALSSLYGDVTVDAQGDVDIKAGNGDAIWFGRGAAIRSYAGSVDMTTSGYTCIEKSSDGPGGDGVRLGAAKDITLNADYTAIQTSAEDVHLTAGGKLSSTTKYGFQVRALTIKANEVSIAGTQQDGIKATSVSITNLTGGNCKSVSVTATSSQDTRAAITALGDATTGNITIKADDLFLCGNDSAKAISANGTVTIGDAGLIVGAIYIGKDSIDSRITRAANGGDVGTNGLNISGKDASGNADAAYDAPTVSTYYTAGSGYILWNPTDTVTLHNATVNTTDNNALALPDDTFVVLEGASRITSQNADGISGGGALTVQGSGTLEASGDDSLLAKQITVTGSASVTVNGIDNTEEDEPSVTVSGSAVLTSTESIFTGSYLQTGSANVTINGKTSPGISSAGGIRIDGGSLNAKSDVIALVSAGGITLGSGRAVLTPSGGKIASAEFDNGSTTLTITSVIPAGEAAFTYETNGSTLITNASKEVVIGTAPAAPSSGDGGGSSSSTVTVPVTGGSGSTNVSASVCGGTATVSVSDAQLKEITSGSESGTVKIDLSGLKADTAVIPAKLVSAANTASGSSGIEVALPAGTVTLDKAALEAVSGKGDVKLSVETVDNSKLTEAQKSALGNQASTALVVDVNVFVNGTQTSTYGDGLITVSVPYTPKSGENTDFITVWFVKDDGTIEPKNAVYSNGKVTFTTQHLSQYLILSFPFADVAEGAWYYTSVAYAYNNGLFAGTSASTFEPEASMTREMIWMVLARMDGKTPADMEAARTWAMENGISDGSNSTNSITREQMATILFRYAQHKGCDTTQGGMAIREFADYDSISEYALTALGWSVNAGLMQGSDNNLMPAGSATRAQVATILLRFCQNVVK